MTRFKEWVRTQGVRLEQDYEYLPYNGIDCVVVVADRAQVSTFHYGAGWMHWIFGRDGGILPLTRDEENEATRAAVKRLNGR